ncbi:MAG: hypothetical protein RL581_59 [Actinomycetota bacterium]
MRQWGPRAKSLSGIAALIILVLSAGIVVSHQCHSLKTIDEDSLIQSTVDIPSGMVASHTFNPSLNQACATFVLIVLFALRKYFLRGLKQSKFKLKNSITSYVISLPRPPNVSNVLDLSQLGVIRI